MYVTVGLLLMPLPRPLTPYEDTQHQQTQAPCLTYFFHEQHPEASGQVQGGFDNGASPSFCTTDPRRPLPLDISGSRR